jgi:hypothetical protein
LTVPGVRAAFALPLPPAAGPPLALALPAAVPPLALAPPAAPPLALAAPPAAVPPLALAPPAAVPPLALAPAAVPPLAFAPPVAVPPRALVAVPVPVFAVVPAVPGLVPDAPAPGRAVFAVPGLEFGVLPVGLDAGVDGLAAGLGAAAALGAGAAFGAGADAAGFLFWEVAATAEISKIKSKNGVLGSRGFRELKFIYLSLRACGRLEFLANSGGNRMSRDTIKSPGRLDVRTGDLAMGSEWREARQDPP